MHTKAWSPLYHTKWTLVASGPCNWTPVAPTQHVSNTPICGWTYQLHLSRYYIVGIAEWAHCTVLYVYERIALRGRVMRGNTMACKRVLKQNSFCVDKPVYRKHGVCSWRRAWAATRQSTPQVILSYQCWGASALYVYITDSANTWSSPCHCRVQWVRKGCLNVKLTVQAFCCKHQSHCIEPVEAYILYLCKVILLVALAKHLPLVLCGRVLPQWDIQTGFKVRSH